MSDWIEAGQAAPNFHLKDQDAETHRLSDYAGKAVILYFYPRDDTPGCTKEACAFRDRYAELQSRDAVLLGVSGDDAASHVKFRDKYSLPFPLLVDADHQVATQYGAYREKNMYGKKSMGIVRSTFIIGPDQQVVKVWKRVKVDGHDNQVIDVLDQLG